MYEQLAKANAIPEEVTKKIKDGSTAYTIFVPTQNASTKYAYDGARGRRAAFLRSLLTCSPCPPPRLFPRAKHARPEPKEWFSQ